MKYFAWDEDKNQKLMFERGVSFEICVELINKELVIDVIENHPPYEHQRVYLLNIDDHVYRVPFVEDDEKVFLKTIYPSRKDTKKYFKSN